jgi:hypothetical protein
MPDYDLKATLGKMQSKRMNFALFKGEKANQLFITPKPATPTQIAELEKTCGALKRLAKGICFLENEHLVFATAGAPAPAWEAILTKILKDHQCAKYLPVGLRQLGPQESDEVSGEEPDQPSAPPGEPAGKVSLVAFQQSRLAWDRARKTVQSELQKLEKEILAACKDEPDIADIAAGTKDLYEMLEVLDERLIDTLDEALNAESPEKRAALHLDARGLVDEYRAFVNEEALIQDIDANGFVNLAVRSTLTSTLDDLAKKLSA